MTPLLPPQSSLHPFSSVLGGAALPGHQASSTNLERSRKAQVGGPGLAQAFIGLGWRRGRLIPPLKPPGHWPPPTPVPTHHFLFPAWLVGVRGSGGPGHIPCPLNYLLFSTCTSKSPCWWISACHSPFPTREGWGRVSPAELKGLSVTKHLCNSLELSRPPLPSPFSS